VAVGSRGYNWRAVMERQWQWARVATTGVQSWRGTGSGLAWLQLACSHGEALAVGLDCFSSSASVAMIKVDFSCQSLILNA